MFDFLKSKRRKDEDRACKAYSFALNFTRVIEVGGMVFGTVPDDDKSQLAYDLMLYGALDAAGQACQVPDDLYLALVEPFFVSRGRTKEYAYVLIRLSQDQGASNAAFFATIEGGRIFQEWMRGNAMAPCKVIDALEKYTDDPAFPATPGHLMVTFMEREGKAA